MKKMEKVTGWIRSSMAKGRFEHNEPFDIERARNGCQWDLNYRRAPSIPFLKRAFSKLKLSLVPVGNGNWCVQHEDQLTLEELSINLERSQVSHRQDTIAGSQQSLDDVLEKHARALFENEECGTLAEARDAVQKCLPRLREVKALTQ